MKRYIIIFLICILCIPVQVYSSIVISGSIKNIKGEVAEGNSVYITTLTERNKALVFGLSDSNGSYKLTLSSDADSLLLRVRGFNIIADSLAIPNKSGVYDFVVQEGGIAIENILVRADKIRARGDTVDYNVASFMSERDLSIADVLKKMPGINVKKTGIIEYHGKPISALYIEGMDLLKGRYSLATSNIAPQDISTVQVLERHQGIEALRGLIDEDGAAINLKIQEGKKGIWSLLATLGIGGDKEVLWENDVIGSFFGRTRQHLFTYKNSNTGSDIYIKN